ncbi:TonB-dependent receptor [Trinickia acidisoli]|uniref:TonB-dependent receptor n=1 Tax=Trinickia acidisoli TaxID=2767482 RepID=UPI001A8C3029|nr:TonB-dependent receptor [Trinickia acidisoli]
MQRVHAPLRLKPLTRYVFAALCMAGAQAAHAQATQTQPQPVQTQPTPTPAPASGDLGSVKSTATTDVDLAAKKTAKRESAPANAPTQSSLEATEPQSKISRKYIENNAAPTANYSDIVAIAPSVMNVDPNGSGLMESQALSIRGFQDGQYNVTFDGVPFGDSNDFTHHSTSFFTNQEIGSINVDRGPGDASQIGFATFGGTIAMDSKEPSATPGLTVFGSYGSWDTALGGLEYNSGVMQNWGDARVMVGGTDGSSDGYLTNASQRRQNLYFKLEKPIGNDTLLTIFADYNNLHQNVSYGATAAQIAQFGPDYGLSGDPTSQAYYGYNFDKINTDFEYLNIRTKQFSWTFNNKIYTYGYYHNGFNGADPNGESPNGVTTDTGAALPGANDVPGVEMNNNYRAWGDIFSAERDLGPGKLTLGGWLAYQTNFRNNFDVDDTLNFALPPSDPVLNDTMQDTFLVFQPFAQYEWKLPQYGLTITPGLRYVDFSRNIYTPENQKTGTPLDYGHTWTKLLPSITVNERLNPNWSTYVQFAQGYLAPNLNVLYVNAPAVSGQPDPEQTNNYQLGTVYKSDRVTFDADLYYIDFLNMVKNHTVGGVTYFSNGGGADYKGFETEGTVSLGHGFNVYANLTLNSAKFKDGSGWVQSAPKMTAAAGLLYSRGPLDASAIFKFVGRQPNGYTDVNGNSQPLGGYGLFNLAATYTIDNLTPWSHDTKIGLQIDNVFNRTSIIGTAGNTVALGTPLFWTAPGRAVIGTISTTF